jgi:membrane protease YdiL (CAAX protease family)
LIHNDLQTQSEPENSPGGGPWVTLLTSLPHGLISAIFWLAAMLGAQWALQQALESGHVTAPEGWPDFTFGALVMVAFTCAILVWIGLWKKAPLSTVGITLQRLKGDLVFAAAGSVVVGMLYLLAGAGVRAYFEVTTDDPAGAFSSFLYGAVFKDPSWQYLFGVVVFYPVVEEIWYRGILYPPARKELGRLPAILITSLLFAFSHSNALPINQFFGGLVFVIAFEMRRTLIAPILLHMLGNGTLAALGWIGPKVGLW